MYNQDKKMLIMNALKNIITGKNPICNFIPTPSKEIIQYQNQTKYNTYMESN